MYQQYRWDPQEYRDSSSNQRTWAVELLSKIDLSGSEAVLDVGCGDGEITALIAARVPQGFARGIDSSREMVELARRTYPPRRYRNLRFAVRDARRLNMVEEFDLVFSNASLHWVVDHTPVLERIRRSLKPSGRLLAQMGGRGNAAEVVSAVEAVAGDPKWSAFLQGFDFPWGFYGPEEYEEWLRQAGLTPERIELVPKVMIHVDKETFSSWISASWLPYTQRVPEESRAEFVPTVVARYLQEHPLSIDGCVRVQMTRLEVEARK